MSATSTPPKEEDAASSSKNNDEPLAYVCVHCATPCASLYRRLSVSLSSIKTMTCEACGQTVDPYIEREWLLVAIDCILLRDEAYRHVLFNVEEFQQIPRKRAFQFLAAWSILDGYLKWETLRNDETGAMDEELLRDTAFIFSLGASSLLGKLLQCWAMYFYMTLVAKKTPQNLDMQLVLALLLPSSFSVVTIFVIIWENTKTVRLLGSLLIAYWQGIAVSVISSDIQTPLVGLIVGVLWRLVVSIVWVRPSPCIGLDLELPIPGGPYNLCLT
jgi:hypothetical protein